jgi:porin
VLDSIMRNAALVIAPGFAVGLILVQAVSAADHLDQAGQAAIDPAQPDHNAAFREGTSAAIPGEDSQAAPGPGQGLPDFGGRSSVPGQLRSDAVAEDSIEAMKSGREGLQDQTRQEHTVVLGGDYSVLGLYASESLGEDTAIGGVLRMYGQWTPLHRASPTTGTLIFKIEHRHTIGTDIPPQSLGFEAGYVGLTGTVYSDAGAILTNLYWTQRFADNRLAINLGVTDLTDYIDLYGLANPWTEFNNLAFSTSPTIPVPNQGLAAAARLSISDNYYILAGIADANADPGEPEDFFDSFFNDAEYFKHAELGWFASFDERFSDSAHLFVWQADERTQAGVPEGWGATLSYSRLINQRWMPFARAGYADDGGTLLKRAISVGSGYILSPDRKFIGFGAQWGRAADSFGTEVSKRNQYTFELYMRWQPLSAMQVTPGLQLIINPAQNPTTDRLWIPGLRFRAIF